MPHDTTTRATAAEVARQFSHFTDMSLSGPVIVTKNGRERNVLLSIEDYNRLVMRSRTACRAEDTPDVFMANIDTLIASLPEE